MQLYYHPLSPNCTKVLAAARLLGQPLDLRLVDLQAGEHRGPAYLDLNPNGLVPLLIDGSLRLSESEAILAYLAETAPDGRFRLETAAARAERLRWQFWAVCHWNPALRVFVFERVFKGLLGLGAPDENALLAAGAEFRQHARLLDHHLRDRPWIEGEALGLSDLSLAALLAYHELAGLPLADFPAMNAWYARLQALPEWQETLPPLVRAPA